MKSTLLNIFAFLVLVLGTNAEEINTAGDWDDSGSWKSGNIGDDVTEDVSFKNATGTAVIRNTFNYTIGAFDMNNSNTLTINSGGSLNVGNASNADDLSTGNTATLNVNGDLTIWGNLDVGNTLILNVTGNFVVKGNINMGNGASLDISGSIAVDGNFTGGNNTDVNVDGGASLSVGGSITVGTGSTATGAGSITFDNNDNAGDDTCDDGGAGFCTAAPLPVSLLYFRAERVEDRIEINWATGAEIANSHFVLEKSTNLEEWDVVEVVQGAGNSIAVNNYQVNDFTVLDGGNYYMLKQVDFDGTETYYEVVAVEKKNTNEVLPLQAFPTVTKGWLKIKNFDPFYPLFCFSIDGVDCSSQIEIQSASGSIAELNVSALASGTYVLTSGGKSTKIIKN